jgi:RNA polymerase sigma-70 factor (ECF subfamily)
MDSPTAAIRLSAHESSAGGASRPAELTDDQLIASIRDGSSEALGVLFKRYARLVWTVACRILRNREEADDLVSEVFLLIRKRASVFDSSKGTVRSLLVHMVYQRAFSKRRDLKRRDAYHSDSDSEKAVTSIPAPAVPLYDQSLEAHFGKEKWRQVINGLSQPQRDTLHLYYVEGYSFEEIATKLGCSLGNVQHHYYRSIAKLRERLGIEKLKNSVNR